MTRLFLFLGLEAYDQRSKAPKGDDYPMTAGTFHLWRFFSYQ
jgi:hypothetical protein